jgi:nucleotide-binding universal stress UspA family protein
MFENILVGVDGTSRGRDAISFAERLAGSDARTAFVHVRASGGHLLRSAGGHGAGLAQEESEELLGRERDAAQATAELASVEASSPGAGLHREAERREADLIVVGSSARGLFGRAMLGDDTRGALNGAPCAVAIASRGYEQHPFPIARIGVAFNGSPESARALAVAQEIAGETRADVVALEVVGVPTTAYTGLAAAAYGAAMERMVAEAKERMAALEGAAGRVAYGVPGEELAAFSAEVDLLVVGSRSYGPLRRLVLGSTSDFLARHARSSLLVLARRPDGGE